MSGGTRLLFAVLIGLAIGILLGVAGGLLRNEGLDMSAGLLAGAAGGLSAGVIAVLLRPKTIA